MLGRNVDNLFLRAERLTNLIHEGNDDVQSAIENPMETSKSFNNLHFCLGHNPNRLGEGDNNEKGNYARDNQNNIHKIQLSLI